jgi:methylated-DNA-protein-cysteine methyltransferase-like protein
LKRNAPKAISRAKIYAVIARIPKGRVATYGQIASLAGIPAHARQVGYALSALPDKSRVPWHRVVNAAGRVSPRAGESPMANVQRFLLEREGLRFDADAKIPLKKYRWQPRNPARMRPK